jgi:hypothetical protein
MRLTIRTLMLIVALLAVAFASPDPLMVAILIFGCPLWVPVLLARQARRRPVLDGGLRTPDKIRIRA